MEEYQLTCSGIVYNRQKSISIRLDHSGSFGISTLFQIMKWINLKSFSKAEVDKCGTSVFQMTATGLKISRCMRYGHIKVWVL